MIGVTVKTPEEAELALNTAGVDAIKAQFHMFDKRLMENGFFQRAHAKGVQVLVCGAVPKEQPCTPGVADTLQEFEDFRINLREICDDERISFEGLALRYANAVESITSLIIAVDKRPKLVEYLRYLNQGRLSENSIQGINSMSNIIK